MKYSLKNPTKSIHNWHGDVKFGLPLDVGDSVEILEECPKWFRGTCPRKSRAVGIFPKTYIHVKDLTKVDPVVAECTQVLREWSEIWKKLFVDRETYKFNTLRKVMFSILESRRELLGATLTQDQTLELQMTVVSKIDWGNSSKRVEVYTLHSIRICPEKDSDYTLHFIYVSIT
uniref:SH3 domain-containing protein n=1 Tax=Glossina brevipalpis TaxID=37001 RepID=A0A1A9WEG1_9MUSC